MGAAATSMRFEVSINRDYICIWAIKRQNAAANDELTQRSMKVIYKSPMALQISMLFHP